MFLSSAPLSVNPVSTRRSDFGGIDTVPAERTVYVTNQMRILSVLSDPEYTVTIPLEARIVRIQADRDTLNVGESV